MISTPGAVEMGGAAGSSAATLRLFPVLVQTSRGRGRPGHSSCGRWNLWFCLGLRKHSVLAHQGPGHRLTRALQPLLCVGGGFVGNWEIAPPQTHEPQHRMGDPYMLTSSRTRSLRVESQRPTGEQRKRRKENPKGGPQLGGAWGREEGKRPGKEG